MWKFLQSDKKGTPAEFEDGHQIVTVFSCPPLLPQKSRVFGQKFTVDGTSSASDDLGIDGSVTNVKYWVPASEDDDRYIVTLSFILGYGASAEGFEFADSGAALTNGVLVTYDDSEGNSTTIINPKTNSSFFRASLTPISLSGWEAKGFYATGEYGYFVTVPLDRMMPPYGIKLDRGTNQKISITIRDDCRDADLFNCRAFGFERFE